MLNRKLVLSANYVFQKRSITNLAHPMLLFRKKPEYPRDMLADWLAKFSVESENNNIIEEQRKQEEVCFQWIFQQFFDEQNTSIFSKPGFSTVLVLVRKLVSIF